MFFRAIPRRTFSVQQFDASKDYYRLLNLSKGASKADIKKKFYQLAKQYHPDSNDKQTTAEQEKFK